jgi:hypothetical protein
MSYYGFQIELPRKLKVGYVTYWGEANTLKIPSVVLTKNLHEERMVNFVRAVKQKDTVIWPQRLLYINDVSKKLGGVIRWAKNEYKNLTILGAPSKSGLNLEVVTKGVAYSGVSSEVKVGFPFKKNKEKDVYLNHNAFTTAHSRQFIPEAEQMLRRISCSDKEASTQSIGRMGFRRYFSGIYGVEDEKFLKENLSDYNIVFDDSLGEGNTIRDLFSIIQKYKPNSEVILVALAFDRQQDKK